MSSFHLPNGKEVKLGCLQPTVLRCSAVPTFDSTNEVLAESDCPDTESLKPFLSPPKFQNYNNCTNAALAGLGEAAQRQNGTEDVQELSMSFLYAMNNGGADRGAYCRDVALDWMKVGLPFASLWPEDQIYMQRRKPADEVLENAKLCMALEVYQCMNWADVRSALAREFLVYHGFVLGNRFFNTGPDGKTPSFDGRRINGHAMFSFGLTRKFGSLRTRTMNSWGRGFAENGICYLDESYFWEASGNYVNLDAYAIRGLVKKDKVPIAK